LTKASQEEVIRKTEAKIEKMQQGHRVEVLSNKIEAYDEMEKDAVLDYEAILFELQHCEERYKLLESTHVCLKRQFHALFTEITSLQDKRGVLNELLSIVLEIRF